jgi:hypothetical protein
LAGERQALFHLAGTRAKIRHAGERPRDGIAEHYDTKNAQGALVKSLDKIGEKRTENDVLKWLVRLDREARALIKAHWRSVEKVAARLMVKHVLTADDVAELIPAE